MSRASRELIGQSIGEAIGGAFQRHGQQKEQQRNEAIANDPNASDLQRAVAVAKLAGSPIGQQFLKNQQRQTNLQALQDSISNQLNPQGAGGAQQATRNATDPNQFMQGGNAPQGFMNPAAFAQQNQGMGQNVPAPVNAPQQVDPIQELQRQEDVYRNASDKAILLGDHESARSFQSKADALQRDRIAKQNLNQKDANFQQAQQFKIHEKQIPRVNKLREQAENARNRLQEYGDIEEDLRSGKMSPFSFKNFVANKYKGTVIEGMFSSAEREKQKAFSVRMFEGMKEMFGGQLTDAKLGVISGKVIDPSKTPQANQAIIDLNKFYDEQKHREYEIGQDIVKSNGGYIPIDFDQQVQDRMQQEFGFEAKKKVNLAASDGLTDQDSVMMRNPKDGQIYPMPSERIIKALAQGGVIISNE